LSLSVLALWFVCGLGTAILAAATRLSRSGVVLAMLAFGAGAWWARQPFAPAAPAIAIAAGLTAVSQIVRAPQRPYAATMAGLLAGIWTAVLAAQGLPLLAAIAIAGLVPAMSALLRARRPVFAPAALVDEALIVLALVGLTAAALPGIAEGWHAAVNLSVRGGQAANASPDTTMPMWTIAVASTALISGGLFSLWSRR
jgi:hypothetical protein